MTCTRCSTPILPGQHERCWYCTGPLCGDCWEQSGCCGEPEAEALNARVRAGERPTRSELTAGWPDDAPTPPGP